MKIRIIQADKIIDLGGLWNTLNYNVMVIVVRNGTGASTLIP